MTEYGIGVYRHFRRNARLWRRAPKLRPATV